jgi:hypothetical protein
MGGAPFVEDYDNVSKDRTPPTVMIPQWGHPQQYVRATDCMECRNSCRRQASCGFQEAADSIVIGEGVDGCATNSCAHDTEVVAGVIARLFESSFCARALTGAVDRVFCTMPVVWARVPESAVVPVTKLAQKHGG